jgi:hypothetical protein
MKQDYFIKFDRRINNIIGCQRATLILSTLEYWFSKKQEGFYKFIGPCSHPLYKKEDSWIEELGCDPKSFTNSFKKIGVKYKSRTAFEKVEDKFQGKMYASYYDRYSNRVFFVRNHEEVNKFFARIYSPVDTDESQVENKKKTQPSLVSSSIKNPLRNGKNYRSYKETKNSSPDLSKDKSHASDEIVKKMIDIWTAIVGEGKGQIELRGKIIAFLKKAFTDSFNSCLQKWKAYCISITRSKFLMGEKTSFKATLEWALKFDVIAKILSGEYYGIGDRKRKLTLEEQEESKKEREEQEKAKELEKQKSLQILEEEIRNRPDEPEHLNGFRIRWLHSLGEKSYREFLADSTLKVGKEETDLMIQPKERITALQLKSYWNPEILSGQPFRRVQVYHYIPDFNGKPLIFDHWFGDIEKIEKIAKGRDENINSPNGSAELVDEKQSAETNELRARLKAHISAKEYPLWLNDIRVQEIKPDGMLVVTFKDKLASDYARIRFSEKILKSAVDLWSEVSGLMIHQESDCLLIHDKDDDLESDEKTLVKQAIQSLMKTDFSGAGQRGGILNDCIPY